MKHKTPRFHPSFRHKSALGNVNAADTAHLEYGGTLQAVTECVSFAAFTAEGQLSEKDLLQTAFCINDFLIL